MPGYNGNLSQEVVLIEAVTQVRYRKSSIRTSILDHLHSNRSHPSAEEVHQAVRENHPKVSFGTVYRNLNILVDQYEVRRLESSRGRDRFDAVGTFHAHFHCEKCGRIFDLPLSKETLSVAHEMEKQTGHRITGHQVDFTGTCAECAISD